MITFLSSWDLSVCWRGFKVKPQSIPQSAELLLWRTLNPSLGFRWCSDSIKHFKNISKIIFLTRGTVPLSQMENWNSIPGQSHLLNSRQSLSIWNKAAEMFFSPPRISEMSSIIMSRVLTSLTCILHNTLHCTVVKFGGSSGLLRLWLI